MTIEPIDAVILEAFFGPEDATEDRVESLEDLINRVFSYHGQPYSNDFITAIRAVMARMDALHNHVSADENMAYHVIVAVNSCNPHNPGDFF